MSLPISEKTFLERLADLVPGVKGYRDREGRRETDRRLREHMAGRLEEARDDLNLVRMKLRGEEGLDRLDAVGRLDLTLEECVASLRYSDQGYRGLFDQVKIGERELEKLYAYDEALLLEVRGLAEQARALTRTEATPETTPIEELGRRAMHLRRTLGRRKEVFETPSQ